MTGGGFGGCTVSLVEADAVERASRLMIDGYRVGAGREAEIFVCSPSDGAGLIPLEGGRRRGAVDFARGVSPPPQSADRRMDARVAAPHVAPLAGQS